MTMDKSTQSNTAQDWKKPYLDNPMMFWKNWQGLMPPNPFNGNTPSWLTMPALHSNEQSGTMKNPLQKITPYLAFTAQQQKILFDWSNVYMDYLIAVAKSNRAAKENGASPLQAINGVYNASKEMIRSSVSLMDRYMENISALYEDSCKAKEQPAEKA
jgi:hypothetical protein